MKSYKLIAILNFSYSGQPDCGSARMWVNKEKRWLEKQVGDLYKLRSGSEQSKTEIKLRINLII